MSRLLLVFLAIAPAGCDLIDGEPFPGPGGGDGGATSCPDGLRPASGSFFVTNAQLDGIALQINPDDRASRSTLCVDDVGQVADVALSVANRPAGTLRLTFGRVDVYDLAADAGASVDLRLDLDGEETHWPPSTFLSGTIDVRSTSPNINIFGNQLYGETPGARRLFFNFNLDASPRSAAGGPDAGDGGPEGQDERDEEADALGG